MEKELLAGQEEISSPYLPLVSVITATTTVENDNDDEQHQKSKRARTAVENKGKLINFIPQQFKKKSAVWNHYLIYENDRVTANCKHCKVDISMGDSKSTGHLNRHMEKSHREILQNELIEEQLRSKPSK